jgi:hypothetical protein
MKIMIMNMREVPQIVKLIFLCNSTQLPHDIVTVLENNMVGDEQRGTAVLFWKDHPVSVTREYLGVSLLPWGR